VPRGRYEMTESEELDDALDRVARGDSPRETTQELDASQRRLVQMAQMIRGSEVSVGPDPGFSTSLERKLREPRPRTVPRRTALLSGLGAMAAGVAAGIGLDHVLTEQPTAGPAYDQTPLVGPNGHWERVASDADLPEGAVKRFTTGALAGFLIRTNGRVKALSGVCTHMGCLLEYEAATKGLVCPCHGAEFNLDGWVRSYPNGGGIKIPWLPQLRVRVQEGDIEVWTA